MVTRKDQVYVCEICGNKIKVAEAGAGELVCCEQPMKLVEKIDEREREEAPVRR